MPRKIIPIKPPGTVEPITREQFGLSYITPGQSFLFDMYATQSVKIAGTSVSFFSLNMRTTKADLLYGEAVEKAWTGPFNLSGFVEWPRIKPEMRETGLKFSVDAKSWISRQEFDEAHIPYPKVGDAMSFWNVPFYSDRSDARGYFFNITTVDDAGRLNDNPNFTGFSMTIKRNTEYPPEERILTPAQLKHMGHTQT